MAKRLCNEINTLSCQDLVKYRLKDGFSSGFCTNGSTEKQIAVLNLMQDSVGSYRKLYLCLQLI